MPVIVTQRNFHLTVLSKIYITHIIFILNKAFPYRTSFLEEKLKGKAILSCLWKDHS